MVKEKVWNFEDEIIYQRLKVNLEDFDENCSIKEKTDPFSKQLFLEPKIKIYDNVFIKMKLSFSLTTPVYYNNSAKFYLVLDSKEYSLFLFTLLDKVSKLIIPHLQSKVNQLMVISQEEKERVQKASETFMNSYRIRNKSIVNHAQFSKIKPLMTEELNEYQKNEIIMKNL